MQPSDSSASTRIASPINSMITLGLNCQLATVGVQSNSEEPSQRTPRNCVIAGRGHGVLRHAGRRSPAFSLPKIASAPPVRADGALLFPVRATCAHASAVSVATLRGRTRSIRLSVGSVTIHGAAAGLPRPLAHHIHRTTSPRQSAFRRSRPQGLDGVDALATAARRRQSTARQKPVYSRSGLDSIAVRCPRADRLAAARRENVTSPGPLDCPVPAVIGGQPFGNQNARPRGRRPPHARASPRSVKPSTHEPFQLVLRPGDHRLVRLP